MRAMSLLLRLQLAGALIALVAAVSPSVSLLQRHIARAEFMAELWSRLDGEGLSGGEARCLFDESVAGAEVALRDHLLACKDKGLVGKLTRFLCAGDAVVIEDNEAERRKSVGVDNEEVLSVSRQWVKRMIAGFGVCPFTIDENKAGIPRGGIHYAISDAVSHEQAFRDFWLQTASFLGKENSEVSTVLLIYSQPELFANIKEFEDFCECLDHALLPYSLNFEEPLQLVYFHPDFEFVDKDGQVYFVFDADGQVIGLSSDFVNPVSYARRSPWPIINLLRTPQVKAVQKGVPEGKVFSRNANMLAEIGSPRLQEMLERKDWSSLPVHAPYLKTVIQSPRPDEDNEDSSDSGTSSASSDGDLSSLLDTVDSSKRNEAKDESDYLRLADEIERWLREG